ncbi:hypothetical protein ACIBMX_41400 [Streptomyces phaeochromogenes]
MAACRCEPLAARDRRPHRLEPEQVLAQLADQLRMDDDGALPVDAFTSR